MGRRDVTFITDLLSLTGRAAIDITWPTSQLTSEPAEDFGAAPAADGPEAGSRPGHALRFFPAGTAERNGKQIKQYSR